MIVLHHVTSWSLYLLVQVYNRSINVLYICLQILLQIYYWLACTLPRKKFSAPLSYSFAMSKCLMGIAYSGNSNITLIESPASVSTYYHYLDEIIPHIIPFRTISLSLVLLLHHAPPVS